MSEEIKKLISVNSWFISLQISTIIIILILSTVFYLELRTIKHTLSTSDLTTAISGSLTEVSDWKNLIRDHNPRIGNLNAEIVLIGFSDYQCPYCKSFNESTREQLVRIYGDRLLVIYKHYPLSGIHPEAQLASIAAQCASREGKFWELDELIFDNSNSLSEEELIKLGSSIGLAERYARCISEKETLPEIEQDLVDGNLAGVEGTPTFLINGKLVIGAIDQDYFNVIVSTFID